MSSSRYNGQSYYNFLTEDMFVFFSSDFNVVRRNRTFFDAFLPRNDIRLLEDILEQLGVFQQNSDASPDLTHKQFNPAKRYKSVLDTAQIPFTDFKQLRRVWGVPEAWIPRRVLILLKEAWNNTSVSGFKVTKKCYMRVYMTTSITKNADDDDQGTFLKQCLRYLASFCRWLYSDAARERLQIAYAVGVMGCGKMRNNTSAFSLAFRNSIECFSYKTTSSTHRYAKEIGHAVCKLRVNADDKELLHWSVCMYVTRLLTWRYSSKQVTLQNGDIDCSPKMFSMMVGRGKNLSEHPWYRAVKEFSVLLDSVLRHFGMIYSECNYDYYKCSELDEQRQNAEYVIYESLDAFCDSIFINWSVPLMYSKLHALFNVVNPTAPTRAMMKILRQTLAYAVYFEFNTTLGDYTEKMSFKRYQDGTQGVLILKHCSKEEITFWAQ